VKKYFLISASILLVIFHSLRGFHLLSVTVAIMIGIGFILSTKSSYEYFSRKIRASRAKIQRVQKAMHMLDRISDLPSGQIDQLFSSHDQKAFVAAEQKAKIYHLKPKLGLVQFKDEKRELQIHEVTYQAHDVLTDMQCLEERALHYPSDQKKLFIFVSEQTQSTDSQLIDAIRNRKIPQAAIQTEIFRNTDVIEIANKTFLNHRKKIREIEQLLSEDYQQLIYMYPEHLENIHTLKLLSQPNEEQTSV
jgi:hypothetical protein